MQHTIATDRLGSFGPPMAQAVQACVHCGFCLPVCPTYQVLGEEMDSPRGRIFLMKEVLEERVAAEQASRYIDRCLGCVACVTACPSGVQYGELLTPFRAHAEADRRRSLSDRWLRRVVLATLPRPRRFRWAARTGRLLRSIRWLLPARLRAMLALLPARLPEAQALPEVFPAEGSCRGRVALLAGCAQQVLAPEINWATLRVLARNGFETVIPPDQVCCGALAAHTGVMVQAQQLAKRNLAAFPDDVMAIVTNAAGCGSGMHEYALWLRGQSEEDRAQRFAHSVQDVSVFLAQHGWQPPLPLDRPLRVAYHDACHLAHAQKVKVQPRQLLRSVQNLELIEIPDGELCCGSAGTYNIEQPEIARELGRQKAQAILATGADIVVTGNIGCMTQIETHLRELDRPIPVLHTIELLDRCYRKDPIVAGERPARQKPTSIAATNL